MVESKPERDPGAVRRRALRDGLVIAGLLGMVYFYLASATRTGTVRRRTA
jgi:hypothetical protein